MAPPSTLWKYFQKIDKSTAKCLTCGKVLKTSGNTSNLSCHLRIHKNVSFEEEKLTCKKDHTTLKDLGILSSFSEQHKNKEPNRNQPQSKPGCSSWNDRDDNANTLSVKFDTDVAASTATDSFTIDGGSKKRSSSIKTSESELFKPSQPKIFKAFENINAYKIGGSNHVKITEAIVYYICKDNQPFTTIEGEGFRHLLKETVPLYNPPSRELIKRRIDEKYEILSNRFKEQISKVKAICLTTDIWTETMSMKSFLGVTTHFISDRAIKSGTLGVFEVPESHTSKYLGEQMLKILAEWGDIADNVFCVVTDNGVNIVRAIADTFGASKHLPCAAHTINLVAERSIKDTDGVLELFIKVRNIVKWFKKSALKTEQLRKKQLLRGKSDATILKVVLDVATRWNSAFYMVERFLHLSSIINEILLENTDAPDTVSSAENNCLKQVIEVLRPLEKLTTELSAQKFVSVSKIIPLISCIKEALKNLNITVEIGISLRNNVIQEIGRRFGKVEHNHILAISTLLDPRFKNLHFSDPLACSKALTIIRREITTLNSSDNGNENLTLSEEGTNIISDTLDLWAHHQQLSKKKAQLTPGFAQDEVATYLSFPNSSLKEDPLILWENLKKVFPNLYQLSQRYLAAVASSVPSERLFSKAGATANKARNRLTGQRLSKLLFLNSLEKSDWIF